MAKPAKRRPRPPAPAEVLYGINPVEAALAAGRRRLDRLLVKQGRPSPRLRRILERAGQLSLPMSEFPTGELAEKCGSPNHQGVALHCGPLPVGEEKSCLALAAGGAPLLVALDEVQDPQNLGAVVRGCAVLGADGVVLPRHHASPLSPAASKASAGLLETFPIFVVSNLARFLGHCRSRNFWVAGASEDGETPLHSFRRDGALVLVLGNEGKGLRPLVARSCDFHLAIPTSKGGGLNVAAAAAVLLYQLTRPA